MDQVTIDEGGISLNLVCCSKPNSAGGSGISNNRRKKSKHDAKRRQGGPQTKKGGGGTTESSTTKNDDNKELLNSLTDQKTIRYGKEEAKVPSKHIKSATSSNQKDTTEAVRRVTTNNENRNHKSANISGKMADDIEIQAVVTKTKTNGGGSKTTVEDSNKGSHVITPTKGTKQDEQHAHYMAQYHARPLEMDRRANAIAYIRPSHPSQHIFSNITTEATPQGDEDDENETNNNNNSSSSFESMGVHPKFITALNHMSITQPTSIQSNAIPKLLQLGNASLQAGDKTDANGLCIQCETGSGKTIAYLLPILQSIVQSLVGKEEFAASVTDTTIETLTTPTTTSNLHLKENQSRADIGTRAIIICPTRELATQTFLMASQLLQKSFPFLVCGCLSGGEKRKSEKAKIRKGIPILIATPGRLLDHLVKTECLIASLKKTKQQQHAQRWLVLDEVDRLLDMGLKHQIQEIIDRLRYMDKVKVSATTASTATSTATKHMNQYWKSVLVSATVTPAVLTIAKSILNEDESTFLWSSSTQVKQPMTQQLISASSPLEDHTMNNNKLSQACSTSSRNTTDQALVEDFSRSAPHQLSQLFMVVTSKLRLAALVSFLVARIRKGQSVVVFMSTCDSVDFHHLLFTKLQSILPSKDDHPNSGIFGTFCRLLKLHGNISHGERQQVLKEISLFQRNSKSARSSTGRNVARSYVLLATDVAARGLNLPQLDWIVQYDAPCEVTDYVHRVGRSARAGNAGHAIIFLLPSEEGYIDILKSHGLGNISALSLSSTLQTAAKLCPSVTISSKSTIVSAPPGKNQGNRSGEQFAAGILQRCEDCVIQDDTTNKSLKKKGGLSKEKKASKENLINLARQAFSAYIRAYPTKEKAVRHLFSTRALHLGHVARSFALKESPLTVSKTTKSDKLQTILGKRENAALTFENIVAKKRRTFDVTEGTVQYSNENTRVNATRKKRKSQMAMINSAKQAEQEFSEFA